MEFNPVLRDVMLKAVDNQLKNLDPPETKQTYDRLISSGISDQEARRLIACVVAGESFNILKQERPFDLDRFIKALNKLPEITEE